MTWNERASEALKIRGTVVMAPTLKAYTEAGVKARAGVPVLTPYNADRGARGLSIARVVAVELSGVEVEELLDHPMVVPAWSHLPGRPPVIVWRRPGIDPPDGAHVVRDAVGRVWQEDGDARYRYSSGLVQLRSSWVELQQHRPLEVFLAAARI